jgi:hypothetical protein
METDEVPILWCKYIGLDEVCAFFDSPLQKPVAYLWSWRFTYIKILSFNLQRISELLPWHIKYFSLFAAQGEGVSEELDHS